MFNKLIIRANAKITGLFSSKRGQAMTEYGLLIGILAVAVIAVLLGLSGKLKGIFQAIVNALPNPPAD